MEQEVREAHTIHTSAFVLEFVDMCKSNYCSWVVDGDSDDDLMGRQDFI